MEQTKKLAVQPATSGSGGSSKAVQMLLALATLAITLFLLWQGFLFLRDSNEADLAGPIAALMDLFLHGNPAPKWFITIFAIVWGVGGVAALYYIADWIIELFPPHIRDAVLPYLFVGPAMALLVWYLALPTFRTFRFSLMDSSSQYYVGLANYVSAFTERFMLEAFRNNLLWLVVGATSSVVLGLLVAILADRSRFENLAKALVFLPMAISMVGAGVIWNFIYAYRAASGEQIGLLNAIVVALGGQPQAWTALIQPWNNLFLIVIVVWLQTGYAMVLFSAAIKGIPSEILEASRVDGATEMQVFFRIILPMIRGTTMTVATTVVIFTLKIFDVVIVMTGGQFGTEVIATQFYRQYFTNRNFGFGSTIAIILLIAVIPVMIYNLRQFDDEGAF